MIPTLNGSEESVLDAAGRQFILMGVRPTLVHGGLLAPNLPLATDEVIFADGQWKLAFPYEIRVAYTVKRDIHPHGG